MTGEEFRDRYKNFSIAALLRIVTVDQQQYKPEAVRAAMELLSDRQYPLRKNLENCPSLDEGMFRDFKEAILLRIEDKEDVETIFNDIFNFGYNPFYFFKSPTEVYPPPTFKMTEAELAYIRDEVQRWKNEDTVVDWILIGLPVVVFFGLLAKGVNVGIVIFMTLLFIFISYVAKQIRGARTPAVIIEQLEKDVKEEMKIVVEGTLETITVIDNKSKSKLEAVKDVISEMSFDKMPDKQSLLLSIETEYEFFEIECAYDRFPEFIETEDTIYAEVARHSRLALQVKLIAKKPDPF